MEILFLTNRPADNTQASTVTEYLDALQVYSKHHVYEVSMLHHFPSKIDLDRFDVVITHYSLSLGPLLYHYLGHTLVEKLKKFRGLKAAFLQDEYREIQTYWKHINELGIDVLFSCVPDTEIFKVYPADKVPRLRVVNVLTGYVSERLLKFPVLPVADRSIDVGYRTRKMPYWLGRLGHEKWFISHEFQRRAEHIGLKLDLSTREGERLYGDAWTRFVASCRAMIGVESGASIIDFEGKLEYEVENYVAKNPEATFEEVSEKFLARHEDSLKLILFEGNYSGVLIPWRHFIVLKKDFSNFDEVVAKIYDHNYLQKMADRTYQEVALNPKWSYRTFIHRVDNILLDEFGRRGIQATSRPYTQIEFDRSLNLSINYRVRRKAALFMQSILLGLPFARKSLFGLWEILPPPLRRLARPMARMVSR
jgi:hypothetical protein